MNKKNKIRQVGTFLLLATATVGTLSAQTDKPSPTKELVQGQVKVSGKIIDSRTGQPVTGARVTYGKTIAKITDAKGQFEVELPANALVMEVSMDGYTTKQVPVLTSSPMEVVIYPASYKSLYKTTNTIFGANGILQTTGAVEKLDLNAWEQNSETLDSYVQGRLAGVSVTRKSGTPGVGANVQVRNFNSLYTHNQPLYIVDGVVYNAEFLSPSITTGHENNPLQQIDVRDIQDITLLKDAVSTSIYGARAANGVVVINTNHAKELATKIDFQATAGINLAPKSLPVMSAYGYRSYLNDVLATTSYTGAEIGNMPFNNDNASFSEYAKYHNETDWQKEIFKQSRDQNYYLKVTGGDNIAKYALSAGYNNEQGVIDNTKAERYTARFNGDMQIGRKLTAQTNISLGYGQQGLKDQGLSPKTNPIFLALTKAPFLHPNEVGIDGSISPVYAEADYFDYSNPLQIIHNGINNKKAYRLLASLVFNYKFNDRFSATNLTAVTYDKAQEDFFVPRKGVAKDTVNNTEVFSRLGAQVARYFSISNDIRLNYNQDLGDGSQIQAIAGFRYHTHDAEQDYVLGYNSATDQLVSIGNSTAATRVYGGQIGTWRNVTTYAMSNLTLKSKYLFSASLGIDGSSRFGDKVESSLKFGSKAFGIFPAVGGAWILSNEDFLKASPVVNLFKLRLNYGLVGNDDIGNYAARQNYVSQNFLGVQGLVREGLANPYLKWETVEKINAGIDLSLFHERFNLTFDVYQHTTKDMLVYNKGNALAGVEYYLDNNGSMRNTGIDVGLNGRLIDTRVKWDMGLNLGVYKNRMRSIPATTFTEYAGATYITEVGSTANSFYGYKFAGVYSTQAEAEAAGLGILDVAGNKIPFEAGDAKFVDKNADGIIDENDRFILGSPVPDLFGGWQNTLTYKNWKFGALFTFSLGNEVYNYTRSQLESGSTFYNQTEAMQNRWRAEGQVTDIPKAVYGDPMGNARFSDRWIEDGSYLRLRQVSVDYNFPVNKQIIKYIRVYGTVNNLFTWSKYLGYDPEFASSSDVFHQGVDVTLEPQYKSFQLGVRIGL
ncbi:SusC/RagA family TonB-linked outer membrane protein [Sphingobacterium sp. LRF_L2]|uniref:SusC/RagA family TonB-linked outer membrane protein n=1 Tax=Sphingobacterium sp. LRF_L2 TaxID=3369421 RepID=UPI003F61AFF6